mmetsp:Transcript_6089/g.8914  ORF Transcript_6089/g.8914 Transcript_6089/m.8914 type:complete len:375 (-) Transcript_6089:3989-5113(-)
MSSSRRSYCVSKIRLTLFFAALPLSTSFFHTEVNSRVRPDRMRPAVCLSSNSNDETDKQQESRKATLDVIRKSMGKSSQLEPDGLIIQPVLEGISGFAVDEKRGFLAILTSNQRSTYEVVSPLDTNEVRSAEALCLIQLAGGMDMGTGVLPPDLLSTLVAEELDYEVPLEEIRSSIKLIEVQAIPNESQDKVKPDVLQEFRSPISTPERTAKLEKDVPKFLSSVRNLPGLSNCEEEEVVEALQKYADAEGNLDRTSFSSVLDALRRGKTTQKSKNLDFALLVSLDDEEVRAPVASTTHALGLALRYSAPVRLRINNEYSPCLDALEVVSRFPKFRPLQHLKEDAKLMDGFIPSMFAKAQGKGGSSPPKAEDRAQ